MYRIPEPLSKSSLALAWITLSIAIVAILLGAGALLSNFGVLQQILRPTPTITPDVAATGEAENVRIVAQVATEVARQLTLIALSHTPTPVSTPTSITPPTNTPQPTATATPPLTPNLQEVTLSQQSGGATFTVRLRPASVLNEAYDEQTSPRVGNVAVYSRCHPTEFGTEPAIDEAKAIPFELVFEGEGTVPNESTAVDINLDIDGNFITVKRGVDGVCSEATVHTDSATIALGISNTAPQQQATVYYLVPDNFTAPTIPPLFTVFATLLNGPALTPNASNQLRVLPLMFFTSANIRSTKSTSNGINIIRSLVADERVRVLSIEGVDADQWARVEFDPKPQPTPTPDPLATPDPSATVAPMQPETEGWINIGHLDVVETPIGLLEWAPKQ